MEKAGVKKVIYLFLAFLKAEAEYKYLSATVCGRFLKCKGVLSLIRSFLFFKFMILDNTNYNQKKKSTCVHCIQSTIIQYLIKNENHLF